MGKKKKRFRLIRTLKKILLDSDMPTVWNKDVEKWVKKNIH